MLLGDILTVLVRASYTNNLFNTEGDVVYQIRN